MRLSFASGALLAIVLAALIVGYGALFTINQTQQGLVVRLGKVVDTPTDPGLHTKWPFNGAAADFAREGRMDGTSQCAGRT